MDPTFVGQLVASGLALGAIYALVALGYTLIFVATRVVNFAQGEFVMLGALVGYSLHVGLGFPLPLAVVAAGLAAALVGLVAERVAVYPLRGQRSSVAWVMSTLAVGLVLRSGATLGWGKVPLPFPAAFGSERVTFLGIAVVPQDLATFALAVGLVLALEVLYRATMLGKAVRAVAFNPDAARLMGIDLSHVTLLSFGLSAALAAVAGILVAPITQASSQMGFVLGIKGFAAAAVGGLGSFRGALLGGLLLGTLEVVASGLLWPGFYDVAAFALLILVLLVRPRGLIGTAGNAELPGRGDAGTRGHGEALSASPRPRVPASAIAAGLAALAPLVVDNQFYLLLLELAGIFYIAALGLNLVLGYAGQVSLGHAALFGVGAYASAILTLKLGQPFVVGLVAAAASAAVAGLLLGIPSLRMAGPYLAMATMAFNLIVQKLLVNWTELTGGPDGLPGIPPAALGPLVFDRRTHLYLVLAVALLAYLLTRNLIASRYGRGWMALRDDETAAACTGVDLYGNKLLAFALSAVYAGLAGSLFAHLYRHISPSSFGLEASIDLLLVVILGGMGTVGWPLVGALLLTALPQLPALQALQDVRPLVYGAILLLAVLAFRRGLAGLFRDAETAQTRRRGDAETRRTDGGGVSPRPSISASPRPRVPASRTPRVPASGLELRGVSKRFGGMQALDGVDLVVRAGTIHGLIGPNGSGKTTLVNVVTGLLRPDGGRVHFGRQDVTGLPPHRIATLGIARTFQNIRLFAELPVLDNVLVGAHTWLRPSLPGALLGLPGARRAEAEARAAALALCASLGLGEVLEALPSSLAHGWQRRVELARALALRPRLVLLDEPAAGLAQEEVAELRQVILGLRDQGVTVLLIEHRMELVMDVCDVVTVLDNGRAIAEGPPAAVQSDARVVEAYLGPGRASVAAR
ncbi:MAG: ATP-binding cassette domain-containing protein [Chloroflexi bacterium]|nr:ATP-binding cassette domain-containing protein [Chloroflexota bacterium]